MYRRIWIRRFVRVRRFVARNILHTNDPPHALALGLALGMFVALTPTVGFQMLMVVALASLFKANRIVGIPVVWISNPATFVPIYYPSYRVGCRLLGMEAISLGWWRRLAEPPEGMIAAITFYWKNLMHVIGPLTVGCLAVATPIATVTYVLGYRMITAYRLRRYGTICPPETPAARRKAIHSKAEPSQLQ